MGKVHILEDLLRCGFIPGGEASSLLQTECFPFQQNSSDCELKARSPLLRCQGKHSNYEVFLTNVSEIVNGKFSKYPRNLKEASPDCKLALQPSSSREFPFFFFSENQYDCGSDACSSIAQWHQHFFLRLNDPNSFIGLWFWNICNFI